MSTSPAEPGDAAEWADDVRASFPVLVQEGLDISKKYQVFATPFAFVIDEQGVIAGSGIVSQRRHVGFVLDAAAKQQREQQPAADDSKVVKDESRQRELVEV